MTTDTLNPLAVIGHNEPPDWVALTIDRLAEEYASTVATIEDQLAAARLEAPAVVNSKDDLGAITAWVVKLRDLRKEVIAFHGREKAEFLRKGEGVDAFFFGRRDQIDALGKELAGRGDDYNDRLIAAERERRRQEAAAAAEAARVADLARRKAERERVEAEEAARRARKPERKAELAAAAQEAATAAAVAQVDALMAGDAARETSVEAAAPVADLARTRHDGGHMTTAKEVGYADVIDATKLDLNVLRPYISIKALEVALRAWARSTDHRVPMAGAAIGKRAETVYKG